KAKLNGNETLEKIYFLISRDEAAHRGFYQKILQFEMEEDREGAMADLANVVFNFQMPGVGLIPEYDERLRVLGVGISPQYFLQHGVFPLLRALGTSRAELIKAYRRAQAERGAKRRRTIYRLSAGRLNWLWWAPEERAKRVEALEWRILRLEIARQKITIEASDGRQLSARWWPGAEAAERSVVFIPALAAPQEHLHFFAG